MRKFVRLASVLGACVLLSSCDVFGGGGCSAVDLDIVVEPGFLTNTVSARIVNGSDESRRVTISARDPEGHKSVLGPITIVAHGTVTQRLGPLLKSYGTSKAELESHGSEFKIVKCE